MVAESTRTAALDLQSRAEALNAEAKQISLEDLLGKQSIHVFWLELMIVWR